MRLVGNLTAILILISIAACNNSSTKKGAEEEASGNWKPDKYFLSATELIELADCKDLPCIQSSMIQFSADFLHARKGEFACKHHGSVTDTAGRKLEMTMSTFYIDTNPYASWRAAHTIHDIEIGNKLLAEFHNLGYRIVDSITNPVTGIPQQRYASSNYPGKTLYVSSTFKPWDRKGLYNRAVTWPCFVFEVYKK